ncbi:hypothetical protein ACIP5Y_35130 [Nocardia sp. NPDC088792]|uniref:hypothetical protein n=1 Tax=Nocardia sp. NPDC088792 TaxID=3364332 RepID=UPI0037FFDEA3
MTEDVFPYKAVIFICRRLLTTKADLDWAEFYARQRAEELGLRVSQIVTEDHYPDARLRDLLRQHDAPIVITPNLKHVGGKPDYVTGFAELLTVKPKRRYRWRESLEAVAEIKAVCARMTQDIKERAGQ